jgi:hypothetical protein
MEGKMSVSLGRQKIGRANCNVTGNLESIQISAMDYPNGIGIVQINCDNYSCPHNECYYKNPTLKNSVKTYLERRSIVWSH